MGLVANVPYAQARMGSTHFTSICSFAEVCKQALSMVFYTCNRNIIITVTKIANTSSRPFRACRTPSAEASAYCAHIGLSTLASLILSGVPALTTSPFCGCSDRLKADGCAQPSGRARYDQHNRPRRLSAFPWDLQQHRTR